MPSLGWQAVLVRAYPRLIILINNRSYVSSNNMSSNSHVSCSVAITVLSPQLANKRLSYNTKSLFLIGEMISLETETVTERMPDQSM